MTTVRRTVGQAVVRFLAAQYTERDGARHRRAWARDARTAYERAKERQRAYS